MPGVAEFNQTNSSLIMVNTSLPIQTYFILRARSPYALQDGIAVIGVAVMPTIS